MRLRASEYCHSYVGLRRRRARTGLVIRKVTLNLRRWVFIDSKEPVWKAKNRIRDRARVRALLHFSTTNFKLESRQARAAASQYRR